jgi:hypothetical protein
MTQASIIVIIIILLVIIGGIGSYFLLKKDTPSSSTKIFNRLPIMDKGWNDNEKGPLKKGFYDIIGQGVPNDYCRYTFDAPNIKFTCQLSNDSKIIFAETYGGRSIKDIIGNSSPSPVTPSSHIRYYMRNNYLQY